MSNRSNMPTARLQAEAEAPDLRSQRFQTWRQVAIQSHHQCGTNHQAVCDQIQSLSLDQIPVEQNEEPEPEEVHFPEDCEVLWNEMKKSFAIKTGKAQQTESVSNTDAHGFINDWWEKTGRDNTAHGGLDKTG